MGSSFHEIPKQTHIQALINVREGQHYSSNRFGYIVAQLHYFPYTIGRPLWKGFCARGQPFSTEASAAHFFLESNCCEKLSHSYHPITNVLPIQGLLHDSPTIV